MGVENSRRILLVEDDRLLLRALQRDLKSADYIVLAASSLDEAERILHDGHDIDGVVTDVTLPDGTCMPIVKRALQRVAPPFIVVITGTATLQTVFELAQMGAVALLEKPFTTSQLQEALKKGDASRNDRQIDAKKLIGRRSLQEVLDDVRTEMTNEALVKADGNKTKAAKMLGVSRQAVQQITRPKPKKQKPEKAAKPRRRKKKKRGPAGDEA